MRRCSFFLVAIGISTLALPAAAAQDELVWITIPSDAFQLAREVLPSGADGEALARIAETDGVILTRLPESDLDVLSAAIHDHFGRCGGYVFHPSAEEGHAQLSRVAVANRTPEGTLPFEIDQPGWVVPLAGELDGNELLATITSLSTDFPNRYHAHPAGLAAAEWIRDLWAGYAASRPEVTVELVTHGATTPQPSVRLVIPGSTSPEEVVVLGAHLDSTRSGCSSNVNCLAPGADDDASGIATLSEVLRVVLASSFQPQRTVWVFGYAAEEVGLRGSAAIATAASNANTTVVAALQQDMTGFKGSAQDIWFITDFTNAALTTFLQNLLATYWPATTWSTTQCNYGCSDHASWHNRGYPAAFAFESRFGDHNSAIHQASDTVATLGNSAVHALKFARLALAFLIETSRDGAGLPFADGFESGDASAWTLGEGMGAALAPR